MEVTKIMNCRLDVVFPMTVTDPLMCKYASVYEMIGTM